jgi:hypothetical protein
VPVAIPVAKYRKEDQKMTVEKRAARDLLAKLEEHREKLLGSNLWKDPVNLEEQMYDVIIARLGAVQGCIAATREYLDKA